MFNYLKRILTAPVFQNDESKTSIARYVHTMTWWAIALVVVYGITLPLVAPQLTNRVIVLIAVLILQAFILVWLYQGRVKLGSLASLLGFWLVFASTSALSGGVRSAPFAGNILVVLTAAILWGWQTAIGFATLSIASGALLVWAEMNGWLPPLSTTPLSALLLQGVYFFVGAGSLYLATFSVKEALARAEQRLVERRRVEQTLRDSEIMYRRAIEAIGGVPYLNDYQLHKYSFMGEGIRAMTGYDPAEMTPHLWTELVQEYTMLDEANGLNREEAIRRVLAGETKYWKSDMHILTKDGQTRWIMDSSVQIMDETGKPYSSIGILQDVTERKQAEEDLKHFAEQLHQRANQLATLNELSRAVSTLRDLDTALKIIHQQTQRILPLDSFYIGLYDADANQISYPIMYDDGKEWDESRWRKLNSNSLSGRTIQSGKPLLINNITDTIANLSIVVNRIGDTSRRSESLIFAPLIAGERTIGVISAQSYVPNVYTQDDLDLLVGIAYQAAIAIENSRLYTSVQQELLQRQKAEHQLYLSERRFRAIIEHVSDSVAVLNADGVITFINSVDEMITGYPATERLGKNLLDVVYADDREPTQSWLQASIAQPNLSLRLAFRMLHQDTRVRWIEGTGINMLDEPAVQGILVNYRDVTERKHDEESIQSNLAWRNAILDNIPDMAWLMDNQFRYIAVNEPFARKTHKSAQEIVGLTDFEVWQESLSQKYRQSDQEVVNTRKRVQLEDVLITRTGMRRWFETVKTPILNEQDEVIGITGIAHEITHRKLAEQTLEQYAKQSHQQAEHLAMLNQVGRAISTLQDLKRMLEVIFEQVRLNLPLDVFFVALHNAETEEITFPILYDNDLRWNEPAGKLDKFGRIAQVIRSGEPLFWNRTAEEIEESRQSDYRIGDRSKVAASIIITPMRVGQRVIGVMSAQSYAINAYTEEHFALLTGVAHQAAIAIQNAQLYEQTQQRARQLAMLNEVGRAVSTLRNADSVLEIIYQQAQHCLPLDVFFVALLNTDTDEILFPVMYDSGERLEEPPSAPKKGSTSRLVIQSGQPLLINRTVEELAQGILAQPAIGNKTKRAGSLMYAPLRAGEQVIGAISVQSYSLNVYTQDDLMLLVGIAHQAAIAIENARLYSAVQQELTERQRAQAEREKLITELETKNTELERFTYTVSHDLKSPLVTIRGFLGYLEKSILTGNTEHMQSDMMRIVNATNRMQQLLNELLELSRIGRTMNPSQDVPFNEIVQDAIDLVRGRLSAGNIRIMVADQMPTVQGDRTRLVEVVQNLIDNAAKFVGPQAEPQIEIGTRGIDTDGKPIFFVRDNGIGIAPQYHDKVFGLFNKLDANTEGTGVGLALVKRIVEVHGGRIWVESDGLGKGSTFYFTLPPAV